MARDAKGMGDQQEALAGWRRSEVRDNLYHKRQSVVLPTGTERRCRTFPSFMPYFAVRNSPQNGPSSPGGSSQIALRDMFALGLISYFILTSITPPVPPFNPNVAPAWVTS